MTHTLLAYLLILLFVFLFCYDFFDGKKTVPSSTDYFYISPSTSTVLKGIAAIIIICHHFCLYQYYNYEQHFYTSIIPMHGGNFSLVIFLFLSGYGVTKSELNRPNTVKQFFKRRFWKVLKPCLIIYGLTFIVYYLFMPNDITQADIENNRLNPYIKEISTHNISCGLIVDWFFVKMDWYVYTTLVLYGLFYITTMVYPLFKKTSLDDVKKKRLLLFLLMISVYYIICCLIYSPTQAHYYRNLWAFAIGSFCAYYPNLLKQKKQIWGIILIVLLTFFNTWRESYLYAGVCLVALLILLVIGRTNQRYDNHNRFLLYIGGISYYLYLCHRTFYHLLWRYEMLNFLLFVILSIGFAMLYEYTKRLDKEIRRLVKRCK